MSLKHSRTHQSDGCSIEEDNASSAQQTYADDVLARSGSQQKKVCHFLSVLQKIAETMLFIFNFIIVTRRNS